MATNSRKKRRAKRPKFTDSTFSAQNTFMRILKKADPEGYKIEAAKWKERDPKRWGHLE